MFSGYRPRHALLGRRLPSYAAVPATLLAVLERHGRAAPFRPQAVENRPHVYRERLWILAHVGGRRTAQRRVDRERRGLDRLGDASATGLPHESFDGVVAFMSLQDIDDLAGAVAEAKRVLHPTGWLAIAIVHPLNSGGVFKGRTPDAPFCIDGSYMDSRKYVDDVVSHSDGLHMRFASWHRPVGEYFAALESCGFIVDRLREVTVERRPGEQLRASHQRWRRVPLFLHLRAVADRA